MENFDSFYKPFEQSKYFTHYQSAIEGNKGTGTTFASAADVLRYRLLHHEGGIYIDVDDILISPPGNEKLEIASDELILGSVTNQRSFGMYEMFNNNIFATHENNPLLEKISEEAYNRFSRNPTLYMDKPDLNRQQTEFNKYMKEISYTTGPEVFNDVIDKLRPELVVIKEMVKLSQAAHVYTKKFDEDQFREFFNKFTRLDSISKTGSDHSWMSNRR